MDASADLLSRAYGQVSSLVTGLDPADFGRASGASGWSVLDVLYHLLLDAQRALVTYASPTTDPVDVDAVGYWRPFRPDVDVTGAAAHARFVRTAAAAYASPSSLVGQWVDTADAAARASRAAPAAGRVRTQGHVLEMPAFTSTLVVEAAVHHLDLVAHLPAASAPDPVVLSHTREVLELLAGGPLPATWSDRQAVLIGTGRALLSDQDHQLHAELHDRLPLLG